MSFVSKTQKYRSNLFKLAGAAEELADEPEVKLTAKQRRMAKNLMKFHGDPSYAIQRMIEKGEPEEVALAAINELLNDTEAEPAEPKAPAEPKTSEVSTRLKNRARRMLEFGHTREEAVKRMVQKGATKKDAIAAIKAVLAEMGGEDRLERWQKSKEKGADKPAETSFQPTERQISRARNLIEFGRSPEAAVQRMVDRGIPKETAEAAVAVVVGEGEGPDYSMFETTGPKPEPKRVDNMVPDEPTPDGGDDLLWAGETGEKEYIEGVDPETGKPFKEEFVWGAPSDWKPEHGEEADWRDIPLPAKRPFPYQVAEEELDMVKRSGIWNWLWGGGTTTTEAAKEVIAAIERDITPLVEQLDSGVTESGDKGDAAWRDIKNITTLASRWKPVLEQSAEKRSSRLYTLMKLAGDEDSENIVENVERDFEECLLEMNQRLGDNKPSRKVLSLIREAQSLLYSIKDMAGRGRDQAAANLAMDVLRICDEIDGLDPVDYEVIPMTKTEEGKYEEVPAEEMAKTREVVQAIKHNKEHKKELDEKFQGRLKGTIGDMLEGKGRVASKFKSELFKKAFVV
jgi:hypothetical protein